MLRVRQVMAGCCLLSVVSSVDAAAQTGLVDLMLDTFNRNIVLATTPAGVGVVQHTAVFSEDPRLAATQALVSSVSQQIGSQISNFPLGSSSGGFTYSFDSSLGTFSRTTQTFGPAFAERAATAGKGKFSFGMNYLRSSYDTLDGKDLENGAIKFDLYHQRLAPPSYVEGDVVEAALKMKLKSDTAAFLLNFGVTDRFDIGLAVPIVRVDMDLTYQTTILDFATHTASPTTHAFAAGGKTRDFTATGSASGVGDIVVRGKYTFQNTGQGLALGVDLRVPSGDEANMLGAGSTQTKIFLIGSTVSGEKLAPHVNIGYTFSSGNGSDQFNYVGGLEYGATPKVTVAVDLIGRTVRDTLRLEEASVVHLFQQGPAAPTESTTLDTVSVVTGNLNSLLGAAGVKINAWGNLLISGHLLFGLNDAGLHSSITPVVGFDYSF